MNETTLTQLKIIVERAVRPVRASISRKRKMREELLAHVTGVFEEELAKLGDERASLQRTTQRFGDPAEVTSQLQELVPARDAIARFWEGRPDASTLRTGLRLAWMFQVFVLFVCAASLVAAALVSAWSGEDVMAVLGSLSFVPQFSIGPLYLVGIAFVAHWMENSLRNPAGPPAGWPNISLARSFSAAWANPAVRIALIVGTLCFALLLAVRVVNWSAEPEEWDRWSLIAAGVLFAGDVAGTTVCAAWTIVQSSDQRRRYHEEWANLSI
jgi:hypothetical protein